MDNLRLNKQLIFFPLFINKYNRLIDYNKNKN